MMRSLGLLLALGLWGLVVLGQSLDLSGPTTMGRCEETTFQVHFTAGPIPAEALAFTITLPNAGFLYVPESAKITLHDGTEIQEEPVTDGLDLIWKIDEILGQRYVLPPEETVVLKFALSTGCRTISGTLSVRADYEEESSPRYRTDSHPIQILPGAVLIYKEPSVIAAAVGDIVTWTITVENTGLGPVYNLVVTDIFGPGLAYVDSEPKGIHGGQEVSWEIARLLPGERMQFQLQVEVVACTGLENKADVRFGCKGETCFDTAVQGGTATASIRLILKQPLLQWTPPSVQLPYCDPGGIWVTIPIKNVGEGTAYNVRLCMSCDPLVVAEVGDRVSYEGGCFYLEDPIPPGGTFNLSFRLLYPGDWCQVVPSGRVICETVYENACGEEFHPPVNIGSFSTTYGPAGPPVLSVSLTGSSQIYICSLEEYALSVFFSGLSACGGGTTSDISVTVNIPPSFTVENNSGGDWTPGPDGTGGTITWTISPTTPLSTVIRLRAPGAPRCGQVATLSATAAATDCCGCNLSAISSIPIAIQCYQLVTATHQATPAVQEKCGEIAYTHTYAFASDGPEIHFTDLTFVAYAENAQEYVDGTLTITIDGNPASPVTVLDQTPGGPLIVQGINDGRLVWGHTLEISYRLRLTPNSAPLTCPASSTFYTWTTLDLGPGCTSGDECTEPCQVTEVLTVTSTTPSMAVSLSGLPADFVDPCGTYTITLTLTKTSTYDPHNVVLRLENLNYYIVDLDTIQVSGVQPANVRPTDYGTYYEWTYGSAFEGLPQGAQSVLTMQVRKRCGPGVSLRAEAQYTDACGGLCMVSDTETPTFLRSPNLFIYKTPEVMYATQNQITWTIYVVNSGSGYAYEVWVDDEMGSGLEYVSSTVSPSTGVTTTPNKDHLGDTINGVSWRIAAMAPGEQRVITLVTRMLSCSELWNEVTAGLGCGGEDCLPPVRDFSRVLVPSTQLVATSSTASPIPICAEQPALIRIRNTGDPAVYTLVVRETLPSGLEYVAESTRWRKGAAPWSPGGNPTITGNPWIGYTLEWTVEEIPGLAELRSRETLEIEFKFRALCNFAGGNLAVGVDYTNVCGELRSLPVGTFRVEARRPSLSVNKVQISPSNNGPVDCEGEITWRIDVTNTGEIPIPYVWVEDELGSGFTYLSSTGGVYGVDNGCTSGSKVTWALRNLPPGVTAQLTLTARETGCGELRNSIRAWWGCGQDLDNSSCTLDADCLTDTPAFREIVATRTPTVSVSATLNPTQIPSCGTTTMTLEIRNPSSATASALDVRVGLPTGLTYLPGTTEVDCGTGFASALDPYILPDGYLYWYDPANPAENLCPSIPPGGTIRLRFGVQAACYRATGNASVRVYFYDCCLLSQRQFDVSVPLSPAVPNLTISKTPSAVPLDCFDFNSTVTWFIRVQNTGAASADWVKIEDTLGPNLVYVSSNPTATPLGTQRWGWEFGPLAPGESRTVEITVRMSQPANDCAAALRTNTAQAWWGCGVFDGDPTTAEGCTGGGPVAATARATIPDLTLSSTDIVPILTCVGDGNYTGRVQLTIRNTGDTEVTRDFRLTITEATSGWSVSGFFNADFGGTLPIAAGGSGTITIPNWPVTCGQCTYTFTTTLDAENVLCECREDNNSVSRTWTITLPDLTVRGASLALTCAGDGQARVSGTVTLGNEGCGSNLTTDVPMRFVLRAGPGCAGNVLYTWTTTFTGVNIPAKGEQTFNVSHAFPIDLCATGACTFSVLVEADHTNSVCECDGTNNTLCTDLVWNTPDLTVRREALALTCAGDGQVRISGTVILGNEGCGDALTANVPMRFVLREGPGCTGNVLYTWTTTFTGVNIPAKGEQTFTLSHAFPIDLCTQASGCIVSLLVEADYTTAICECNGGNNTRCVDFLLAISDLRVTSVVPDVGNACEPGTVRVTVENVGCGLSPAGVVVRITGDASGETLLPSLSPGGAETVTVTLNEALPCGSYAITATVDPLDEVCECSSANNARGATFSVVDPDLTITDLLAQCQGDGSFRVTATVRNVGTEGSPATTVRIYVDGALAQTLNVPALPIGGAAPLAWTSPRLKCGVDHLFRLVVDEAGTICECNERNNVVETTARCGCPALVTNKAVLSIQRGGVVIEPSLPIQPGDVITYRLSVTNVGQGRAFDVDVADQIPEEFRYIFGTTHALWSTRSYTDDPAGAPGPNLSWDTSAELAPEETLTLEFQVVVTSRVIQGQVYTNTMWATGVEGDGTPIPPDMSSTIPADTDPDDTSSVSHVAAAVPALSVDKQIVDVLRNGVSVWPTAAVEPGDLIHYRFVVRNIGRGTAYNVDFRDELPEGLEYDTDYADGTYRVDAPSTSGFLGIPDGATGRLMADISATIEGGGTLVADFYAYVTSAVRQGVALLNYATAMGVDGYGTPIPPANAQVGDTQDDDPDDPDPDDAGLAAIGVHEPALALKKEIIDVLRGGVSVGPTPVVLWGDVIVYRVTVRNVGLGTAYDVDLADTLPLGLAYDAGGDGTWTVDAPPASGTLGIPDGATGVISANISATIAGGGTLVARYWARVLPEAVPGSWLTNHAVATGRDGAGTPIPEFNPDTNDAFPDQDTMTIRVGAPALVTAKAYYCAPCDPCAPDPTDCDPCPEEPIEVRVGETVRFQLTVTNVGYSAAYDIVVEDFLPKGLEYVKESAVLTWPGGKIQLEPMITEGAVLTWITGFALEAGESLTIVFAAQVKEEAVSEGEVVNVMRAEGVDAFRMPIPADSRAYVPADHDPDDTDTLRLRVLPVPTGTEKKGQERRGWGMALLGVAGLGGLLGALRRTRLLGLLLLLLAGLGFFTFSQTPRYTVVLVSDPPRAGILLGSGTYKAGELVQVSALPNRGFEFVGWYENDEEISSDPVLEFTADRHRRLVARFRPVLEFVGLTGVSQGKLALTPTTALESLRFEIRSRYQFGFNPWEFRGLAVFTGGEWRDAQGHFTGSWDKARFGGGLMFTPMGPAYRSAYAMLSLPWEDLRVSFRVTHYTSYGLPPSPALLSYLSVSLPDMGFTLRFEEKGALTFKDATLSLFQLGLCCDIKLQGTLVFGKEGLSYLRLAALEIPLGCCGITADFAVTFTVDTKAVEFIPRWLPYCDACLTLYGDVLWDEETHQLQGLALYGYKIRCCFGAKCCPPGPGGYVEFLTALDPSRVPGGFEEGEFEYLKLGFCGPACCGGTYRLDLAIFFRPGGGLFGISRVLAQGSIPLASGLALEPKLELPLQGDAVLSLGWNWRF